MSDTFTPEQISQILQGYFEEIGTRKYIGERYVPIFGRRGESNIDWDNDAPYEPLTIVLYNGDSYTSRQYVPAGVAITNGDFWAKTGHYNAQIANALLIVDNLEGEVTELNALLPESAFNRYNTVKDAIDVTCKVFDTVADMQAATYLEDGMICHTNGFHTSGDGGAAYYEISDSGTANGMDVLTLQNSLFATLVVDTLLNVKMYGAHGNDSDDDTAIINYCISKGQHKTVYIPAGTYKLTNSLNIPGSSYTLIGDGRTNTILKYSENTSISYIIGRTGTTNYSNIIVEGFSLDCNGKAAGIDMQYCTYSRVKDMRIYAATNGIVCSGWCVTIEDCQIFNSSTYVLYCQDMPMVFVKNVQSNTTGVYFKNCNGSLNSCAIDNGNPSYVLDGSNMSLNGCDCETYASAFTFTNSDVSINGGRFELHKAEDAAAPDAIMRATGSKVTLSSPNFEYDDYGTGVTTTLGISANNAQVEGNYTCNVDTPWVLQNGAYINCNNECQSLSNAIKSSVNFSATNTTTLLTLDIPSTYRDVKQVEVYAVGNYFDVSYEIRGTAVIMSGTVKNNDIQVVASATTPAVTVTLTGGTNKVTLEITAAVAIQKMHGTVKY